VTGAAQRDVLKTWLYAAGSVCLGAAVAPFLFNAGQALAEVTASKQTNDLLDRIAHLCRGATFPQFYQASLLAAAALLFLPWAASLHRGERLPPRRGQALRALRTGPLHLLAGLGFAFGQFIVVGIALTQAGSFAWRDPLTVDTAGLLKLLLGAMFWVIVQELLFRGMILGVFLRAMRPIAAILVMGLLFAIVRFLQPPPGLDVADDEASRAGFELLADTLSRGLDPLVLVGGILPLVALGAVLGYARFRTASLWLPIGLHAGWVCANALFVTAAAPLHRPDPIATALAGESLFNGVIPLTAILFTGLLVFFFTAPPHAEHPGSAP